MIRPGGVKDCSGCLVPHKPENYGHIIPDQQAGHQGGQAAAQHDAELLPVKADGRPLDRGQPARDIDPLFSLHGAAPP